MSNEVVHLKTAGLRAILSKVRPPLINHVYDPAFFARLINIAIQHAGLEPRDIADLNGIAMSTVIKWKKWTKEGFENGECSPLPRIAMRKAVASELLEIFAEVLEGRTAQEIVQRKSDEFYMPDHR